MGRVLALAAALIVGALIAWAAAQPPVAQPVTAPPAEFSAARAMADVRAIGRVPHPTGSPAQLADRDYLLRRMSALGLSPQVRRGIGLVTKPGRISAGPVEDLLGVLPGRDRAAPALLLMAHYDSVPNSPGAADDAAGVAAALETVRAIQARGAPARDVMVLLTDGEEADLYGADAFFRRDPLARRAGFVVNLEARGSAGRVLMFQTGARNGAAVRLLASHAVRPVANSLTGFVYALMPNDTDFTEALHAGLPGFNFAFLGGQFDYHAASSTPRRTDLGTLQDLGDQVLAVAAPLAAAPNLPAAAPNLVYSQVFGDLLVAYPPWVGWALLAVAAALIAVGALRGRRAGVMNPADAARGAGALVYLAAGAVSVLHAARQFTGVPHHWVSGRGLLAQASRWEAALMLLAVGFLLVSAAELARGRRTRAAILPLAAALASCGFAHRLDTVAVGSGLVAVIAALAAYGRPAGRPGAWVGVLSLGFVLAVGAQAAAPATAFILTWPLLAGALAAAGAGLGVRRSYPGLALIAVLAMVSLGWLGGYAHQAYLSLDLPELLTLMLVPAAFVLWPLAQPAEGAPEQRLIGPALMIAGAVILLVIRLQSPWSARYPQASEVDYLVDQDAGQAWRVDLSGQPTAWGRAVLTADGGAPAMRKLAPFGDQAVQAAPARMLVRPAPAITLAKQTDGSLILDAVAPQGVRVLSLRLRPDTPARVTELNGIALNAALKPGDWTVVHWEPASGPLRLRIQPGGPGGLEVRYLTFADGWPADARPLPPRPRELMPFNNSDVTLTAGSRRYAW